MIDANEEASGIKMNCTALRSPLGLLKLILMALLACATILSYLGNEGGRLFFGLGDYLGVGVTVGFSIVTPLLLLTYLADGNILVFVSILFRCIHINYNFISGGHA